MRKILFSVVAIVIISVMLQSCGVTDLFKSYTLSEVIPMIESEDAMHTLYVKGLEITDSASGRKLTFDGIDVQSVYMNLEGVICQRTKGIPDGVEEKYTIKFIMTEGKTSTLLYIIDSTKFVYGGYTYEALSGSVNLEYFSLLFSK